MLLANKYDGQLNILSYLTILWPQFLRSLKVNVMLYIGLTKFELLYTLIASGY